jgi:hypothetical protein
MSLPTTMTPTVLVAGYTVKPAGWMWVLAFARAGVPWALKAVANDKDLDRQIRMWYHLQTQPDYSI